MLVDPGKMLVDPASSPSIRRSDQLAGLSDGRTLAQSVCVDAAPTDRTPWVVQ